MSQFVLNFLSYISATYHLNWFTVEKVIIQIKGWTFLLRRSVCIDEKSYIAAVNPGTT